MLSRRHLLGVTALAAPAWLVGCSADATSDGPVGDPAASSSGGPEVSDLVTGLQGPWGLAVLDDGGALLAERDLARIVRVADGKVTELTTLADVVPGGEGGLLGLTLSPDAATLYAYATTATDNRILALSWDGTELGAPRMIFDGIPKGTIHNGGRLRFGPDGNLYVGTGETGNQGLAQEKTSLGGKILRLTEGGAPSPGNPFDSAVWSYGHRNVQGLAFDDSGQLWASEFGNQTWDEINKIEAGADYGWPLAEGQEGRDGLTDPQVVWRTEDASPSGLTFWRGSLWMAALRGECLWQVPLADGRAGEPKAWFQGRYGRLRTVEVAADGASLWLGTSNTDGRGDVQDGDDRLLRVTV